MKGDKIPDQEHILRYVQPAKLRKADGTNDVIGVLATAFVMRDVDDYLSATWIEFFDGEYADKIAQAVQTIRRSLDVKPTSGFTIGKVAEVRAACADKRHNVRIVHEPDNTNAAHVALRRFPRDDIELFEVLASEVWADWFLNSSIP